MSTSDIKEAASIAVAQRIARRSALRKKFEGSSIDSIEELLLCNDLEASERDQATEYLLLAKRERKIALEQRELRISSWERLLFQASVVSFGAIMWFYQRIGLSDPALLYFQFGSCIAMILLWSFARHLALRAWGNVKRGFVDLGKVE